jgi:hypothetical protein
MATAIDPASHGSEIKAGSDRSFGLVFAGVFAVIGLWPLVHHMPPRWWPLGLALVFGVLALAKAAWLHPLNVLWFRLGMLLARVVAPVVMGLVFFTCVTPIGLVMRMRGKDLLSLRRSGETSYWVVREPPGPAPATMTKQF